jgi:phosphate transport system permease protein
LARFYLHVVLKVFGTSGFKFLTGSNWQAGSEDGIIPNDFSIGPMLVGTMIVSVIALVFAVPMSMAGALYLEFYAPPKARRVLVGLCSILLQQFRRSSLVCGVCRCSPVSANAGRTSLPIDLAGSRSSAPSPTTLVVAPSLQVACLASLVIPITTSVAREVYSRTPRELVDTCYALGGTKWGAIRTVVIPFGKSGVVGGAMLGLGRALGETIAVYLLLNINFRYTFRILESEGGNVASLIATKFGEATPDELKALVAAGFVLFVLTLTVNMVASAIVTRSSKGAQA